MRLLGALSLLSSGWLAVAACSSSEARPPMLGDCTADAGCSPPASVGGGGGQRDAAAPDAATCGVSPSASQCDQCAAGACCSPLVACTSSAACQQLLTCIFNCPTAGCVTACRQQFPTGVLPYQALQSCLQSKCVVCGESGVGDPCLQRSCMAPLFCQGLWCSKACTKNADCAGIGPSGANLLGQANVCVATSGGPQCAPGCTFDADCSYFPGTYCHSTLSFAGANVQVCAPVVDASAD